MIQGSSKVSDPIVEKCNTLILPRNIHALQLLVVRDIFILALPRCRWTAKINLFKDFEQLFEEKQDELKDDPFYHLVD